MRDCGLSSGFGGFGVERFPIVGAEAAEALAKEVGEEVVVTEAGFALVGGDDVEIAAIEVFEELRGVAASGEAVADVGAEAGEDGCLEEKAAEVFGLLVEDFFGEEVEDASAALDAGLEDGSSVGWAFG